jgi:hypothetical protein
MMLQIVMGSLSAMLRRSFAFAISFLPLMPQSHSRLGRAFLYPSERNKVAALFSADPRQCDCIRHRKGGHLG